MLLAKTDPEKAKAILAEVYSVIDTAAKKNIIHKNNAARKKSRMAIMVDKASKGELKATATVKRASKKKKITNKKKKK